MSIIGSNILAGASGQGGGYQISRSVRLRASAGAYLARTPSATGNASKFTFSLWIKFGSKVNGSGETYILTGATPGGRQTVLQLIGTQALNFVIDSNVSGTAATTAVFRDPSAWYHIVLSYDSAQAAGSRAKIYVNGSANLVTSDTTSGTSYWSTAGSAMEMGRNLGGGFSREVDGYLTEINFIDGQALTPSSFGQTNAVTGVWQPIKYTGTYGTNGFYLNFSDNSAATATTIGKDYSGNGNNWTPNNISVTAGVTYDSMLDVPTLYADGGNGRGNYAVLNPLQDGVTATYSNGNLTAAQTNPRGVLATMGVFAGKWYWEITNDNGAGNMMIGVANTTVGKGTSSVWYATPAGYGYLATSGNKWNNNSGVAYGATYTTGDVIGVALDLDAGTLVFYKNGVSQGTAFTGLNNGNTYTALIETATTTSIQATANFGQRPFTYTPPTGFVALNTQNLPTPLISNGANYMAASLFTGTSGNVTVSNAVNGISFQPDFLWVKARSNAQGHSNLDSVRGASKLLQTNLTNAESTLTNPPTFNADGFTSTTDIHTNAYTYVAWQWQAGKGSTSSNTSGTITSTVSVGATQGFSVVTYTGTGANATVGHGLGVAPKMIIGKRRNSTGNWQVYASAITNMASGYIVLNLTDGFRTTSSAVWNNTAPSATVFTIGTDTDLNTNGSTNVAYCFAEVAGYSKFGSFTGNGSTDGPFVFCGFRPRFVMFKRADSLGNWEIIDSSRNTYNAVNLALYANLSAAEDTSPTDDFLANGFKIRTTDSNQNTSGGTYIFAAFAEVPFRFANAR